ncbi:MAG: exopolysaccharide regulatory tyrosine autokinase VpsO [Acidobacteriaceae bacterium]
MNDRLQLDPAVRFPSPAPAQLDQTAYHMPHADSDRQERSSSLLFDYIRTLIRFRWIITLCALSGILLSFLFNLNTLPVYRARTSLDIQNLNGDFMNMHTLSPTGGADSSSTEAYVQTQIKLLQSETLLERTVNRLQAEPHPAFIERDDLVSELKRTLHLSRSEPLAYGTLIEEAAKQVKVKPLGVTRLVEITCDSWNAAFSAKFCNTLTQEFKDEDLEVRSTEAQRTSDWLTRQVADVRLKAEESQRKLEAATGGNGLVFSQQSNSVGEDRLRQMQAELVKAQADRMEKEAQSGVASSASPNSLPSVLDNPAYRQLQQQLADLQNKVAEIVPPLTEENPKVIHLRSQIKEVQAEMSAERSTSTSRMSNEYEAARHREALLRAAYNAQIQSVSSDLGQAAKVNLLRREVDSEQQLYQTLLGRAKEAGFASAMQATTIRIVDTARSPRIPVSPQRIPAAGVGLLLGSAFGIGLAFFKDRSSEVFRAPGEAPRYLNVQELGVIPTADTGQRKSVVSSISAARSLVRESEPETTQGYALAVARWQDHFSSVAEAYRNATFSLLLSEAATRRARVYVVSSPNAGEGKTTVTSNLGVALSQSKRRVLLIDADLRKPGLHRALNMPNEIGLRNLLREEIDLEKAPLTDFCKPTRVPNLSLLSSGSGSEEVVELLHSPLVGDLLARLSREFDMILVDTPPMLHMADARILARQADGAILVLRASSTSRDEAEDARNLFDHDRVRLVGTILNRFDPSAEGRSGYYSSYYRYKQQIEASEKAMVG